MPKASPTFSTDATPKAGTAGVAITHLTHNATFACVSASDPTGSVPFTLYGPDDCTTVATSGTGTIATDANGTHATADVPWTPGAPGTYHWVGTYLGNTNNNGFTSTCGDPNEQISVAKIDPTITTQASPTTGTAGVPGTFGDTATFHTTTSTPPIGSVTFTLYSSNTCPTTAVVFSGSGAISTTSGTSTASYSRAWTPTAPGTYYWRAAYAGDAANNNGFTTGCL